MAFDLETLNNQSTESTEVTIVTGMAYFFSNKHLFCSWCTVGGTAHLTI